jgi:hypothetical protein
MTESERDGVRASRETQKVEYMYILWFVLPLHHSNFQISEINSWEFSQGQSTTRAELLSQARCAT